ncbi:hypothetical protein CLU79DRAFT_753834 [Phycomyces nitens]|nr:hypothetical protein CLU79DRAFT_753834 [Phycomyces nitens]
MYSNDMASSRSRNSTSSMWSKLANIFHHSPRRDSLNTVSTVSSDSADSSSTYSVPEDKGNRRRQRKQLKESNDYSSTPMVIPPYSPTYCKSNEFPYSNFYIQLPDGTWMIRYRSGDRDILRTDNIESYMI